MTSRPSHIDCNLCKLLHTVGHVKKNFIKRNCILPSSVVLATELLRLPYIINLDLKDLQLYYKVNVMVYKEN